MQSTKFVSVAAALALLGGIGLVASGGAHSAEAATESHVPVTATVPDPSGTLSLLTQNPKQGDSLTFSYTTDRPNSMNWVGLYDPASGGPFDEKYHSSSTVWKYVDGTSGTVTLPSTVLSDSRDIAAYFLFDDGYTWLAKPLTFQLAPAPIVLPPRGPHFVTDDFTVAPVPASTTQKTDVAGLWFGSTASSVSFAKTAGDSWLSVSTTGTVTAKVPSRAPAQPGLITVTATDPSGATGDITVEVPVASGRDTPSLKTATLNLWDGGSHVTDSPEKLVKSILTNRLDVVGVQESGGTQATAIAKLLGWHSAETSQGLGIISRYPVTKRAVPGDVLAKLKRAKSKTAVPAMSTQLEVDGRAVNAWIAGLDDSDSGPERACLSAPNPQPSAKDLVAHEKTTLRYAQAKVLATAMRSDLKNATRVPVILLADLASPSAADWTRAMSAQHCAVGAVSWPVPRLLQKAGLTDSFRVAEPDARREPGITLSPVRPLHDGTTLPQPQDRVDYVDFAGRLRVAESHALVDGFPAVLPDVAGNSWTSDHAAVVTTFDLR